MVCSVYQGRFVLLNGNFQISIRPIYQEIYLKKKKKPVVTGGLHNWRHISKSIIIIHVEGRLLGNHLVLFHWPSPFLSLWPFTSALHMSLAHIMGHCSSHGSQILPDSRYIIHSTGVGCGKLPPAPAWRTAVFFRSCHFLAWSLKNTSEGSLAFWKIISELNWN